MDEDIEYAWDAGFEGDRVIVVSRIGPFLRVFRRPKRYSRRFHHRAYELPIEDWRLPVPPLNLNTLCRIEAEVAVRFQPTVKYAEAHVEHLPDLGAHIRNRQEPFLLDTVEQELRRLDALSWLDTGFGKLERRIENAVNELLVLRHIHCRTSCVIKSTFAEMEVLDKLPVPPDPRYRELYLELLRRGRDYLDSFNQERHERGLAERRARLEQEEELLELRRREEELRKTREARESARLREEIQTEEQRAQVRLQSEGRLRGEKITQEIRLRQFELEAELQEKERRAKILQDAENQLQREIRLREEKITQENRLRQLELEAELQEKEHRAKMLEDAENQLQREIEVLALERQRLLLEEEIGKAKAGKDKGWIINTKLRFPFGDRRMGNEGGEGKLPEPEGE